MADLQYTAYRIEAQARNFEKATEKIHHYIYLTDSLTRSNMQFSAGMVERDYFKERSKFAEYRMKNRTTWEITIASVIFRFFVKFGGKFFSAHLANSVSAYIFL